VQMDPAGITFLVAFLAVVALLGILVWVILVRGKRVQGANDMIVATNEQIAANQQRSIDLQERSIDLHERNVAALERIAAALERSRGG
jgi:hypothetical protein